MLFLALLGTPLFIVGVVAGLAISLLTRRWVSFIVCSVVPAGVFRNTYLNWKPGFYAEQLVFPVLVYVSIVFGAIVGIALSIPISKWLSLRKISTN